MNLHLTGHHLQITPAIRDHMANKLEKITAQVLHNFLIERPEATTAAERFFGSRPEPLMPWLLARLPMPNHPWQRRTAA